MMSPREFEVFAAGITAGWLLAFVFAMYGDDVIEWFKKRMAKGNK